MGFHLLQIHRPIGHDRLQAADFVLDLLQPAGLVDLQPARRTPGATGSR